MEWQYCYSNIGTVLSKISGPKLKSWKYRNFSLQYPTNKVRICQWLKSPWGCTWTYRKRSPPPQNSAHKRSSLPPDQMWIVQLPWLDLPRFNRSLFKEVICFTCVMSFIFKKNQQNKKIPSFPLFIQSSTPQKTLFLFYSLDCLLTPYRNPEPHTQARISGKEKLSFF